MSNDPGSLPPATPPASPMPSSTPPVDPINAVKGPAIGLMATAAIGILWQAGWLLLRVLGVGLSAMEGRNGIGGMFSGGIGIMFSVIAIIVGAFIIYGAMQMQKLKNYNLAMGASVIAMVPCISPCCIIGLPIGIWALVILLKPEVKAAFSSGAGGNFPVQM